MAYNKKRLDYEFLQELGKGGYGSVYKVRNKNDNEVYALKVIRIDHKRDNLKTIERERNLAGLNHKNIVRYHTSWVEESENQIPDDTDSEGSTSVSKFTDTEGSTSVSKVTDNEVHDQLNVKHSSNAESSENDSVAAPNGRTASHSNAKLPTFKEVMSNRKFSDSFSDDDILFQHDQSVSDVNDDSGVNIVFEDENNAYADESWTDNDEGVFEPNDSDNEDSDDGEDKVRGENRHIGELGCVRYKDLHIQMEYCDSTLRQMIDTTELYNKESEIWNLFRQILKGIKFIHEKGIIHRDLNPKNIFLSKGIIKIGDFGLSRSNLEERDELQNKQILSDMTKGVGTPLYTAPEVRTSKRYGKEADMYSIGLVLFEMNYKPIFTLSEKNQIFTELEKKSVFPTDFDQSRDKAKTIITALINENPSERFGAETLLDPGERLLPQQAREENKFRRTLQSSLSIDATRLQQRETLDCIFASRKTTAGTSTAPNTMEIQYLDAWNNFQQISRQHGATFVQVPACVPYHGTSDKNQHILFEDGLIMSLPVGLMSAFAVCCHSNLKHGPRAYASGQVWKLSSSKEVAFSPEFGYFVFNDAVDRLAEAELLLFLQKCAEPFTKVDTTDNMVMCMSHDAIDSVVVHHRIGRKSNDQVPAKLTISRIRFAEFMNDLAMQINTSGDSDEETLKINKLLSEGFENVDEVLTLAEVMGFSIPIKVQLNTCSETPTTSGLKFELLYDTSKRVIARGGKFHSTDNKPFLCVIIYPEELLKCQITHRGSSSHVIDIAIVSDRRENNVEVAKILKAIRDFHITGTVLTESYVTNENDIASKIIVDTNIHSTLSKPSALVAYSGKDGSFCVEMEMSDIPALIRRELPRAEIEELFSLLDRCTKAKEGMHSGDSMD